MKNIIITLILTIISMTAYCQSYNRNGNNFTQVSTKTVSVGTKTKYTFTDSKGKQYPIYITEKGRCYVMKISSKTNKEYKYYLKEDISKEVCKEMHITYVPKESKK